MKKLLLLSIFLLLCGCNENKIQQGTADLIIYTDPETKVQYISPRIGHGLCLRVDKNGKPMIEKISR